MIVSAKLNAAINAQIGHELENSNRYVAIASYFEGECLFGLAKIYFKQADEERQHAMKFVKFLLVVGGNVVIPQVPAPPSEFATAEEAAQSGARFGSAHDRADLRTRRTGDGGEKLYRRQLPSVVRQRAARRDLKRPDAIVGYQTCRPERSDGGSLPGARGRLEPLFRLHAGDWYLPLSAGTARRLLRFAHAEDQIIGQRRHFSTFCFQPIQRKVGDRSNKLRLEGKC